MNTRYTQHVWCLNITVNLIGLGTSKGFSKTRSVCPGGSQNHELGLWPLHLRHCSPALLFPASVNLAGLPHQAFLTMTFLLCSQLTLESEQK